MRVSRKKYWAELWSTLLQSKHEGDPYKHHRGFKRIYKYWFHRDHNIFDRIYFDHIYNEQHQNSILESILALRYKLTFFFGIVLFPVSFVSISIPGAYPIMPIVTGTATLILGLVGAFGLALYKVIVGSRHIGFIDQIGIDSRPDLNTRFVNELLTIYPPSFFHALNEHQLLIVAGGDNEHYAGLADWLRGETTDIPSALIYSDPSDVSSLKAAIKKQRPYRSRRDAVTAWVAWSAGLPVGEPVPTSRIAVAAPAAASVTSTAAAAATSNPNKHGDDAEPTATERTPLLSRA